MASAEPVTKRVGCRNGRSFQSQSPVKVLGMDFDPLCHLNCSKEKGNYGAGQLILLAAHGVVEDVFIESHQMGSEN